MGNILVLALRPFLLPVFALGGGVWYGAFGLSKSFSNLLLCVKTDQVMKRVRSYSTVCGAIISIGTYHGCKFIFPPPPMDIFSFPSELKMSVLDKFFHLFLQPHPLDILGTKWSSQR